MTSLEQAVSDDLYWMGYGKSLDWKQQATKLLSGSVFTGVSFMFYALFMLHNTFTYADPGRKMYETAAMYCIALICSCAVFLWGLHRKHIRLVFTQLRETVVLFERDFCMENMGSEFVPTINLFSNFLWYSLLLQGTGLAFLPVQRSILPPALQTTWAVTSIQVYQSGLYVSVGMSGYYLFSSQVSFVFYVRSCLALLGRLLPATDDATVTKIARIHSKLLDVSEFRRVLYSPVNFTVLFALLSLAIISTVLLINGVFIFSINSIFPLAMLVILMMCSGGDLLQNSSETFAYDLFCSDWHLKSTFFKRILLFMMLRCRTTERITASVFGTVAYPLFITVCKNHYRFVQTMLNLK